MIQMSMFPDLEVRPTPAMRKGASSILQCDFCGTLVVTTSSVTRKPGPCPCCDGHGRWSDERDYEWEGPGDHIVGPFYSREADRCAD